MIKKLTWIICMLGNGIFLHAQLQSPDQFLPHALGENFTPHHLLVDYFEHVAANSELVQLNRFGYTNEDRPLLQAFISTPENLARLEAIRINNLRRTGLMEGAVDPALDVAIVWLSYSVHGNEAAGSESSMGVIYELTRPDNMDTKAWLKNTVVIMDPSINPDGYSRYTHWYRRVSNKITNTNPAAREHDEPWPGGRVNHYMFDLNRDWAWQTQIESQQRLKVYRQWYPHIHADLHEQSYNDPYYFAPAARPYHEYLTDWQAKFQIEIGKNHAKYFDKEGWLYFTKEVFDLLYPSYGDTYPMFTGAIGMTYEQGGSGRGGKAIIRDSGDTLSLKDRVVHHLTTSLSTVEMASKNAARLIQQFSEFFQTSQNNPKGQYKTYIIKGTNPAGKLKRLTALLDKNGIQYGRAKDAMNSLKVLDYQSGQQTTISLSKNDLLISAYQPLSVLTQTLFDPSAKIEDSLTYDITAWALPYAYGLTTFATTQKIEVAEDYSFQVVPALAENEQAYAYLVSWESVGDAQFLAQLLRKGIKVRYATAPFSIEGVSYESGTLVMNRADNRKNVSFDATVKALAQSHQQAIKGIKTGFSEHGPDLGSDAMHVVQAPEVAILSEEGVSPNAFGQVWHYFEQVLNYPTNIIYSNDFGRLKLEDYNLLILPSGNYDFSPNELKKLSDWLSQGGRLIAQGAALQALEGKSGFGLKSFESKEAEEKNKKAQEQADLDERLQPYAGGGRRQISQSLPGAIFRLQMDNSHPLGYGLDHQYFTLKTGTDSYPYQTGMSNVGTVGKKPITSGFVGKQALEGLEETMVFAVERKGRGSITYMVDNPLFRGFLDNGLFLFSNAVFFVGN